MLPTPRNPDVREGRFSVPMLAIVVDAVLNVLYIVEDEYPKVCSPLHVLDVVVPKAREIVFAVSISGYVNVSGDAPPPVIQVLLIEKQPPVRLIPFANVDEEMVDVILSRFVSIPPVNVEVAVDVEINELAMTTPPTESF